MDSACFLLPAAACTPPPAHAQACPAPVAAKSCALAAADDGIVAHQQAVALKLQMQWRQQQWWWRQIWRQTRQEPWIPKSPAV